MSKFLSKKYENLEPYTPGEQPQDKQYIKLNTNESPFPPSPFALRLMREAAGDCQLYSDPESMKLNHVLCEKYGIENDQLILSNGSDEVLNYIVQTFCDDETPIVFPDVTYGFYKVIADLNLVPYEEIPLKSDFSIDVNDYIGINKNIFIANPNAQTGVYLELDEIEKIISSNKNNIVVVDEAYVDFGSKSAVSLVDKYDNLIVTQTFSKSRSLAGARLGFAIANKEIIRDLNTIKYSCNPYNVNRMTMNAGIGALIDDEYFSNNCSEIIKNRDYLTEKLKSLGFTMTDSKANFVFAKKEGLNGEKLYLDLKDKGILVRHFKDERMKDYIRITIGSKDQLDCLLTALEEIL